MDREKLNKAAIEFDSKEEYGTLGVCFIKGAQWLMQQPLSERLSEAERDKIRDIMKHPQRHTEPIKATLNFQAIGIKKVLTEIFGADLFREK